MLDWKIIMIAVVCVLCVSGRHGGLYRPVHCDLAEAIRDGSTVTFHVILKKRLHTTNDLLAATHGFTSVADRLEAIRSSIGPTEAQFSAVANMLMELRPWCKQVWDGYNCEETPVAAVASILVSRRANSTMCLFERAIQTNQRSEQKKKRAWLADVDDGDLPSRLSMGENVAQVVGLGLFDYTKQARRPQMVRRGDKKAGAFRRSATRLSTTAALGSATGNSWSDSGPTLVNWPTSGLRSPFVVEVDLANYNTAINDIIFVPICKGGSTMINSTTSGCADGSKMTAAYFTVACNTTKTTVASFVLPLDSSNVSCSTFASEEATFTTSSFLGDIGNNVVCTTTLAAPIPLEAGYVYDIGISALFSDSTTSESRWLQNFYDGGFYNLSSMELYPGVGKVRLVGGFAIKPAQVQQWYSIPPSLVVTNNSYKKVAHGILTLSGDADPSGGFNVTDLELYLASVNLTRFFNASRDFYYIGSEVPPDKGETTLDMEMIAGTCPGARVFLYNVIYETISADAAVLSWVRNLTAVKSRSSASPIDETPPTVWSSSYSLSFSDPATYGEVDLYLGMLSAAGVAVLTATGDSGSQGSDFEPAPFPWYSQHVVNVGGTQIISLAADEPLTESVCSTADGNSITSSGGFYAPSGKWPSYQEKAVAGYCDQFFSKFGYVCPRGRAVPDVSSFAANIFMIESGEEVPTGGTSAASPTFGGILNLINVMRAESGLGSLQLVPQMLYSALPSAFQDIVRGDNCAGKAESDGEFFGLNFPSFPGPLCYPAIPGWDPSTGLGSINFTALSAFGMSWNPSLTGTSSSTPPSLHAEFVVGAVVFVFAAVVGVGSLVFQRRKRRAIDDAGRLEIAMNAQ